MALSSGTRVAGFEILGHLGSGGMGDVYRARDVKLGREVAIKVLPEEVAGNEERLTRFEREARILASLNHPGIATLHGLETSSERPLLVMELVEGETLAARLSRGSLPIEEVLSLFRQIAEALESAHGKGILHRDLKPSNIMITSEGRVKLLDFGLAKAFLDEVPESGSSQSPTRLRQGFGEASPGTAHGVILGTASYMSPEQARGKTVDRRTDIWSFGAVLYEALSGRKAFAAETVTDTLAAVVRGEPDFTALPRQTPARIRDLVSRCLRKDANQRIQHVGDARIALEEAGTAEVEVPVRSRRAWLAAAVAAPVAAALTWLISRPDIEPQPVTRSILSLPVGSVLSKGVTPSVAIAPDGRTVAYIAGEEGTTIAFGSTWRAQLYLRALNELEGRPVPGSVGATMPFFSPDGNWVGFSVGEQLLKAPLSGGAPALIAKNLTTNVRGGSWGDDGKIVITISTDTGLSEVAQDSGEIASLTRIDRERRERTHRLPDVLPGSRAVLFTLGTGDIGTWDEASIAVFSKDTGANRVLVEGGSNPRYSASGHLLYAREGAILAVPFDAETLQVRGTPVTVVEGVSTSPIYGQAEFALSEDGTLVYAQGGPFGMRHRIVWVDREGRVEPLVEEERAYVQAMISPDDRSLAIWMEGANSSIWTYDISRGTLTRLAAGFENDFPLWTPDGRRVTFRSNRSGRAEREIFWQPVDGSSGAELLVPSAPGEVFPSWSPDGRVLAYSDGRDIYVFSMEKGESTKLLGGDFDEGFPAFSPDGRWLAYASNESGRWEIYLRAYPDLGRKWQVSTDGGVEPRFRRDGRELFYRSGDELMVVEIESTGEQLRRKPRVLFAKRSSEAYMYFNVASDGRFVFIEDVSTKGPPREIVLVQNFFRELERLVPRR